MISAFSLRILLAAENFSPIPSLRLPKPLLLLFTASSTDQHAPKTSLQQGYKTAPLAPHASSSFPGPTRHSPSLPSGTNANPKNHVPRHTSAQAHISLAHRPMQNDESAINQTDQIRSGPVPRGLGRRQRAKKFSEMSSAHGDWGLG